MSALSDAYRLFERAIWFSHPEKMPEEWANWQAATHKQLQANVEVRGAAVLDLLPDDDEARKLFATYALAAGHAVYALKLIPEGFRKIPRAQSERAANARGDFLAFAASSGIDIEGETE